MTADGGRPTCTRGSPEESNVQTRASNLAIKMGEGIQTPGDHAGREPGLGNPRWRRYHPPYLLSTPDLWNAEAVGKALAILKAQEGERERRQEPLERP